MPRSASASVGLGSKLENTEWRMPAWSSNAVTGPSKPACRIPLSVTTRTFLAETRFSSCGNSRIAPRPCTMRVGKLITFAIGGLLVGKEWRPELKPGAPVPHPPKSSDDLEVALELPLRHSGLELAAFPVACAHVVIDELRAENLAHFLAARERLGRRPQGGRQGRSLRVISIARRLRRKRQLVLHAVEAGTDRRGERDVRIHCCASESILDPGRRCAPRDYPQRAGAILDAPARHGGRPGAANHPLVGVDGGRDERGHRGEERGLPGHVMLHRLRHPAGV